MDNQSMSCNFKVMSFNVRGLRDEKKRKSIFRFVKRKNIDICFIQEAHSTLNDEETWKKDWEGDIYYSNGGHNARGVLVLIKPNLDFKMEDLSRDHEGRLLTFNCYIQGLPVKLINVYAPNTIEARIKYFRNLKQKIRREQDDSFSKNIILGGDFNTVLNYALDRKGGCGNFPARYRETVKLLEEILEEFDLVDVWRIRNPNIKRYTWRQRTPQISSRLDIWFISRSLCDSVDDTDIIPAIKSDHSPILLSVKTNKNYTGKGLWKVNNSFLEEENYVLGITRLISEIKNDNNFTADHVGYWEYLKYKIRLFSLEYGRNKAKEKRDVEKEAETELKRVEEDLDKGALNQQEKDDLETKRANLRAKLNALDDYKLEGIILRSKCQWYEKGEKSNKYFLRMCARNKIKTTMNKLLREDGSETFDHKEILDMQKDYYETLYSRRNIKSKQEKHEYLSSINTKKLSEEFKNDCEGILTLEELDKSLKSFKSNKSPGNDGITVEFYEKFWPLVKKPLLDCLNSGYINGKLSTSQRQAVITLIDKGKDRRLLKNWRPISLLNVDYKIGTKVIAERIKKVLPSIIHENQVGYIKGRQIADNIRAMDDIYFYTKLKNIPGMVINIDFEKAFDSVDWEFLELTMQKFNFGESVIKWVKTFYNDISSCVVNNGTTSQYFKLSRGVRQGDPLSPYLFLLVT